MVAIASLSNIDTADEAIVIEPVNDVSNHVAVRYGVRLETQVASTWAYHTIADEVTAPLDAIVCYAAEFAQCYGVDCVYIDERLA